MTMLWRGFIIATAILLHLLAVQLAHADETVSLKVGFMSLDTRGSFGASAGGLAGTPIDVNSTLHLGRSNGVTAEAALQLGDMRASLNYFPLNFSGYGSSPSAIQYNGQTYAAGDTLYASLKADVYDASLTYYLVNMDDLPTRLQFGLEAAVKVVHATSSLQDLTAGQTQTLSATLPMPTFGVRGRVALSDFIGLSGRAGYMGYAGNRFLDGELQIEFSPLPASGIYAGYRLIKLKVDRAGMLLDDTMSGPFAGGFVRF